VAKKQKTHPGEPERELFKHEKNLQSYSPRFRAAPVKYGPIYCMGYMGQLIYNANKSRFFYLRNTTNW
jgi:hypothetical protein